MMLIETMCVNANKNIEIHESIADVVHLSSQMHDIIQKLETNPDKCRHSHAVVSEKKTLEGTCGWASL